MISLSLIAHHDTPLGYVTRVLLITRQWYCGKYVLMKQSTGSNTFTLSTQQHHRLTNYTRGLVYKTLFTKESKFLDTIMHYLFY